MSKLPEGYAHFCPDRAKRKRITEAQRKEMELCQENARLRAAVQRPRGWRT